MPSLLHMPGVAAGTTDATLLEWLVAENAPFQAAETLVTLETDKAVVDVAAEADGVVLRRLVPVGAEVAVGQAIALLGAPGETVDDIASALARLGVGPGPSPDESSQAADVQPVPAATNGVPTNDTAAHPWRLFASPLARRLAKDAGLALTDLQGTGPNGRIMRRDVETALAERAAPTEPTTPQRVPAAPARVPGTPTAPAPQAPDGSAHRPVTTSYTDRPLTRSRKAIAARLTESQQSVPHFYLSGVVHADKLLKLRTRLNAAAPTRISLNDLVLKAVAVAHLRVPAMNVIWTADAIRQFDTVDVALAVATADGLLTPVVRGVDQLTATAVASATKDFVERARAGRLQQHELEGGSITVTNLGMFGTREFAAIINPPHSSILAVGAAVVEPVARRGKVAVGQTVRLTLSVDHRPVDGATAAEWMQSLIAILQDPLQILV